VEDWAEIRRLHRSEKMPIKQIARVLGVSRDTVRAAIASDTAPKYERKPAGSIVDAVEPRIRELLQATPTIPATVIAERAGWTRSVRVLAPRVAELQDQPRARRPGDQVGSVGGLGDPGALAQPVGLDGRVPALLRDDVNDVLDARGHGEPEGEPTRFSRHAGAKVCVVPAESDRASSRGPLVSPGRGRACSGRAPSVISRTSTWSAAVLDPALPLP